MRRVGPRRYVCDVGSADEELEACAGWKRVCISVWNEREGDSGSALPARWTQFLPSVISSHPGRFHSPVVSLASFIDGSHLALETP